MTSIGTHCYGGGGKDSNSGNAIGGQWGNDYTSFIKLFALDQSTFGTPTSIEYMDPNNTGGIINRSGTEQEGFRDVFKSIARIGSSTAPLVGSLLGGPIGGIIGTVAGGFLGSLSEVAAAAAESTFEDTGAAERAILAEACLQTILQLPSDHPATKNIIDHMQRNYTANAPNVDVLAQVITPQITEAALEITAARYIKAVSRAARPESTESVQGYSDLLVSKPESAVGEGEAFAEGLFSPTRQLTGEEASEIFSWLGPVLKKAVSVGRPLLSKAAKAIITDVAPKLLGQIVGTIEGGTGSAESVMQNPIMMSRKQPQVRLLLKRALIADAALQALQALPADQLRSVQTKPEPAGSQAEGIFDSIKKVVQKIGPAVLDTTKQAIKTVAPILLNAAAKQLKDIINPGGVSGGGVAPVDPPIGPVHSGSVLDDLLSGSSNPIQVSNNVQLHSRMLVAPPVVFHERVRQQPVLIPDLTAELSRRDEEWETSTEHRKSWDSNDDFMPILEGPPPEDF
ncbi:hypothetical protein QQS21_004754 [Conoideocrella luteorostrata]|uniref:Uncharacterized protein n=1 Tax=Conoideocrella luteorostrata TaxID=1105319 RepID=A0AAJ0FV58_9HYPO|nr:hypothetical protein QQS21_004754 [Conoideocrella luteorostrata]